MVLIYAGIGLFFLCAVLSAFTWFSENTTGSNYYSRQWVNVEKLQKQEEYVEITNEDFELESLTSVPYATQQELPVMQHSEPTGELADNLQFFMDEVAQSGAFEQLDGFYEDAANQEIDDLDIDINFEPEVDFVPEVEEELIPLAEPKKKPFKSAKVVSILEPKEQKVLSAIYGRKVAESITSYPIYEEEKEGKDFCILGRYSNGILSYDEKSVELFGDLPDDEGVYLTRGKFKKGKFCIETCVEASEALAILNYLGE